MTKFEFLTTQSPQNIVCTWKSLGSLKATDSTKIYSRDNIYLIKIKNSNLFNCLVYCTDDKAASDIKWNKAEILDYDFKEISFGNNIVSAEFKLLLTKEEYEDVDQSDDSFKRAYNRFVPYEGIKDSSKVIIPEDIYMRCLSPLGVPFVQEDELEYTRREIMELAIQPALEEYFHWVPPVKETTVAALSEEMEVDMPSDAYGVVGLSLQQNGTTLGGNATSPLFYAIEQSLYGGFNYSALSGSYTGNSPYTNTTSIGGMLTTRAASQAVLNYTRRIHYEGPYDRADGSRYIKIYSNVDGNFNVWWAIHSLNFNDIEYANRRRVIEYAQACVKELFGNLRRQAKSDIPGRFEYDKWISEAEKTKDTITTEWKKLVKYSGIIRGSL